MPHLWPKARAFNLHAEEVWTDDGLFQQHFRIFIAKLTIGDSQFATRREIPPVRAHVQSYARALSHVIEMAAAAHVRLRPFQNRLRAFTFR